MTVAEEAKALQPIPLKPAGEDWADGLLAPPDWCAWCDRRRKWDAEHPLPKPRAVQRRKKRKAPDVVGAVPKPTKKPAETS